MTATTIGNATPTQSDLMARSLSTPVDPCAFASGRLFWPSARLDRRGLTAGPSSKINPKFLRVFSPERSLDIDRHPPAHDAPLVGVEDRPDLLFGDPRRLEEDQGDARGGAKSSGRPGFFPQQLLEPGGLFFRSSRGWTRSVLTAELNGCPMQLFVPFGQSLFPGRHLLRVKRGGERFGKQRIIAENSLASGVAERLHLAHGEAQVVDRALFVFQCPGDLIEPIQEMLDVTAAGKLEFLLLAFRQMALGRQLADLLRQQYFELLTGPVARSELRIHPAIKLRLVRCPQLLPCLCRARVFERLHADAIRPDPPLPRHPAHGTRPGAAGGDDCRQKQPDELVMDSSHDQDSHVGSNRHLLIPRLRFDDRRSGRAAAGPSSKTKPWRFSSATT